MSRKGLKAKHKAIVGVRPKKDDLRDWNADKFMKWFKMIHFFTLKDKMNVTFNSIKAFQERARTEPYWEEWMWRFDIGDDKFDPLVFRNRLVGINGTVGNFLQENPHIVNSDMKGVMEANPFLKKYTEPFVVKELSDGSEIVSTDLQKHALPEVQFHKAILKLSALANDLVNGLTREDLKKISPEDRIKLANTLIKTMTSVQGGHKPNVQIFKSLVVNQANKDDLESALVEMSKLA